MGIYNRLRVLILDPSIGVRDTEAARAKYDHLFEQVGGTYAGYQSHSHSGPRPSHFYLIDDPTVEVMANLLKLAERKPGMPLRLFREYNGDDNCELTIESVVQDASRVLEPLMLEDSKTASANEIARCWTGVQVLALMARD